MLRICLILAIAAGLAAGIVTVVKVQDIIVTTRDARNDFNKKWTNETAAHNKTKKELSTTKKDLESTQNELKSTKNDLDAANNKAADLEKKGEELTAKLEKASADRDTAQEALEQWRELNLTVAQVRQVIADNKVLVKEKNALIAENKVVVADREDWKAKYFDLVGPDVAPPLPPGLRGKILAVDPKFDFVVLNIGSDQGVLRRGEMLVDRNGKLLGKVKIYSVEKNRCVANILPGWTQGEIVEGDEVLY